MKTARLVVLIVAIGAGGVAAMLASRSQKPAEIKQAPKVTTVDVLVAKSDIPMGKRLTPSELQWQTWPQSAGKGNFIRRSDRPNAVEQLTGSIVRVPFVTGEPIRDAKVVDAKGSGYMAAILPEGMRAVSTQISAETGAGGFILPNDHVDVILTRRDREAEKATGTEVHTSQTILGNVRVLAIDQNIEEKNGQKVVVGKTATLELSPHQTETLALAQQLGSLSLALRSLTDAKNDAPQTVMNPGNSRRNGVSMVRYGISTMATSK
jgi:pilus assembly protein CpaB